MGRVLVLLAVLSGLVLALLVLATTSSAAAATPAVSKVLDDGESACSDSVESSVAESRGSEWKGEWVAKLSADDGSDDYKKSDDY